MKALGKFKLVILSLWFMGALSSCLDTDDDFTVTPVLAYILQESAGESAVFTPAIQLYGNEPIVTAKVSYEGRVWNFKKMDASGYMMEIAPSYASLPLDTVPRGYFAISAVNEKGEQAANQIGLFGDKPLGEMTVTEFAYTASTGKVAAKWNRVENADSYYLVYRTTADMWLVAAQLRAEEKEGVMSATVEQLPLDKGTEYQLGIAAYCKSVMKVGTPVLKVANGEDAALPKE